MIEKVVITNKEKSPLRYLKDVPAFKNGSKFVFKKGVNVVVGENGSGKSTLLNLIGAYMLVNKGESDPSKVSKLYDFYGKFANGVHVYSDYNRNVFRMVHPEEMRTEDYGLSSFLSFGTMFQQMNASTGEGVVIALNNLFKRMFGKDANLKFPKYDQKYYKEYAKYIEKYRVKKDNGEYTILIDEPDRNLDIENVNQILSILSEPKEATQLIVVVHNPLLIYNLSNNKTVNIIELTEGYVNRVKNKVDQLIKGNDG